MWVGTDRKLDSIVLLGFTPFFRLGISWPNEPRVPTFPPMDPDGNGFSVFAAVCKRTVMHYTQGWSRGFTYTIPCWEIWNEPDLKENFWSGSSGTPENFYAMYKAAADSIKSVNPQLNVGGPGPSYGSLALGNPKFLRNFISYCRSANAPLDFYSWHLYDARNPFAIKAYADTIRSILNAHDFSQTKSFITEIHPELEGTAYNNTPKGLLGWLLHS